MSIDFSNDGGWLGNDGGWLGNDGGSRFSNGGSLKCDGNKNGGSDLRHLWKAGCAILNCMRGVTPGKPALGANSGSYWSFR